MIDENTLGRKKSFFSKIDWASFWTATVISLVVYFFTLCPSVSLEDSGELAVAGDHLGVPHPPGYPIWTIISYIFCRIFSFVTFRGQPTPAWCIALASAVTGAFAAGCTAMLITRSAKDMLSAAHKSLSRGESKWDIISFAGGVGGSLIFAFSPVMWSQSTIVEVYSLGALFLMLVMLLTYRWMREPSDKLLWVTAFVFGLGLTNYQVLLLAALPLVIIIFLRNVAMFRDFLLTLIPFGVASLLLKAGALPNDPGLIKHEEITTISQKISYDKAALVKEILIPNMPIVYFSIFAFVVALALVAYFLIRQRKGIKIPFGGMPVLYILATLSAVAMLFASYLPTSVASFSNIDAVALAQPTYYTKIVAFLLPAIILPAIATLDKGRFHSVRYITLLVTSIVLAVIAIFNVETISAPVLSVEQKAYIFQGHVSPPYSTNFLSLAVAGATFLLIGLSLTTEYGICFALPISIVNIIVLALTLNGTMLGLTHPTTWWFIAPVIFNFVILFLATIALPCGFSVAITALAAELGVSFYGYMPIVSDLRNPPMNWGYPRTWDGFKHAIMRGQYEQIAPTAIFAPKFLKQIGGYLTDLRTQFTLLVVPFALMPFAAWHYKDDEPKFNLTFALAAFGAFLVAVFCWVQWPILSVFLVIASVAIAIYGGLRPLQVSLFYSAVTLLLVIFAVIPSIEAFFDKSRLDILTILGILITGVIGGLFLIYNELKSIIKKALQSTSISEKSTIGLVFAGIIIFVFVFLFKTLQAVLTWINLKGECNGDVTLALGYWDKFAPIIGTQGRIITYAVILSILIIAIVIALLRFSDKKRLCNISLDGISRQWLIGTFANFFVMSFVLIVLANPKGDIQDGFIQKVKFISSHGLFALWIGYGLIFAIVAGRNFLKSINVSDAIIKYATSIAALLAFFTFLIPIHENYCNDRLVFELGSAEQNGHDFGWQFGNYQLRGAEAINEELSPDEEPLPNPLYPPQMGTNAVFFGGTDPGRFVPTYMIYSAKVRPDVFLITQNALADNTFMATTRALYADDIWIPSPTESGEAFQIYLDEVNSGKRPQNADISIEGGRVQVTGALGVMEINGILTKMLHDHNKDWHEFYVEESYVIQWMFPYLTPHGLIMHINHDPAPITAENAQDDCDFWDWYTRRLTRDQKYRRDFPAQKSFSKLRTAIAGLYMSRGMISEAEQAFIESRTLYPISPEACFRYIQELLTRQNRLQDCYDILKHICKEDPNNDRAKEYRDLIKENMDLRQKVNEFCAKYLDKNLMPPKDEALNIVGDFIKIGRYSDANMLLQNLEKTLAKPTAEEVFLISDYYSQIGNINAAQKAMDRIFKMQYVQKSSERLRVAIQIYSDARNYPKTLLAIDSYIRLNPQDWKILIERAKIAEQNGDHDKALLSIFKAMQIGRETAIVEMEKNEQLTSLANEAYRKFGQRQKSPTAIGF